MHNYRRPWQFHHQHEVNGVKHEKNKTKQKTKNKKQITHTQKQKQKQNKTYTPVWSQLMFS